MNFKVLSSLDEALGEGAEALIATARDRHLLNGVSVGIVKDGECMIRATGEGIDLTSRFEAGSITKTYTAELLSLLAARGVVRLNDPVAKYLGRTRAPHHGTNAITLEDLATHHSGLAKLPTGLPLLSPDPYASYGAGKLEEYIAQHGLQRPSISTFLYSNLGYSLLGHALSKAAGMSYADLLRREILAPLGMMETDLALGQRQPSLVPGNKQSGIAAPHWHFDVCAPCGALCSTIQDQVRWLHWLLQDTDRDSFIPRAQAPGGQIGLAWILPTDSNLCWHNGATAGFSSWISLDRRRKNGIVLLSNRQATGLINDLGRRLHGCLNGGQPGKMTIDYGAIKTRLPDLLQTVLSALNPVAAFQLCLGVPVAAGAAYGLDRLFGLVFAR